MKKYIKALSLVLALTSSVYLPSAMAASKANSTNMLITVAETNPVLIERLDDIALNDPKRLKQLLKLARADAEQLERLVNLAESDPDTFDKLVTIKSVAATKELTVEEQTSPFGQMTTFGMISDGGVKRN